MIVIKKLIKKQIINKINNGRSLNFILKLLASYEFEIYIRDDLIFSLYCKIFLSSILFNSK
jgi:hypothetical protein